MFQQSNFQGFKKVCANEPVSCYTTSWSALTPRHGSASGRKRQVSSSERHTFQLKKESHNERKMEN